MQNENVSAVKHFSHLGQNPSNHKEWKKNVLPSFQTPDLLPSALNVLPQLPLYNAANYIGAQQIPNRSIVDTRGVETPQARLAQWAADNHTNNTGGLVSRAQDLPDKIDRLVVGLLPSQ